MTITHMEYVVKLIRIVFLEERERGCKYGVNGPQKGSGICIFTKEVAETKVETVLKMAKGDQHPLKCIMEAD